MRWLFLDRIGHVNIGESIVGYKGVGLAEDYFQDHFPGFPVVPGVVITEALAQVSGKLIELSIYEQTGRWPFPILSMVNKAKFRKFVKPGHLIELRSEVIALRRESAQMKVEARVEGKRTTSAELTFVYNPYELPETAAEIEAMERKHLTQIWPGYGDFLETSRKTTGIVPEGGE